MTGPVEPLLGLVARGQGAGLGAPFPLGLESVVRDSFGSRRMRAVLQGSMEA